MAKSITFYPGFGPENKAPFGKATVKSIHVPSQFQSQGYEGTIYNFAVLKLNTPIGNKSGYLGIKRNVTGTAGESLGSFEISGYINSEVEGPEKFNFCQVHEFGDVFLSSNGYTLKYKIDTAQVGQVGAPVFRRTGGKDYIAGINCLTIKNAIGTCLGNQGRYITQSVYELIVSLL